MTLLNAAQSNEDFTVPADMATALIGGGGMVIAQLMVEGRMALIERRTSRNFSNVPAIAASDLLEVLTGSNCATLSETPKRLTMFGITGAGNAETNFELLRNWQAAAGQWLYDSAPTGGKAQ